MTTVPALRLPAVRSFRFVAPNATDAPKLSRDHVAWLMEYAGNPVPADAARLLVSEVVTNVHLHTASPVIGITTTFRPEGVHIDVYDTSTLPLPAIPAGEPCARETETHGRGLRLLAALSSRWGWSLRGGARPVGKSVWFELYAERRSRGGG